MKSEPFGNSEKYICIVLLLLSLLYPHSSTLKETLKISHMSIISRALGINVMTLIHSSVQITQFGQMKRNAKHLLPLS